MMRRCGVCGAVLGVLLCTSLLHARPGIVRTNDGQSYAGDVNDSGDNEVVVTVNKIPIRIPRNRVTGVEYTQSFEQQFAERMAKLDSKDAAGRIALAKEAINAQQYAHARDALESALAVDPNSAEATQLLEQVRSLMRLERKAQAVEAQPRPVAPAEPKNGAGEHAEEHGAAAAPAGDHKLLSTAQINAVKQWEMRPDDRDVRVRFERNVEKRFVDFNSRYQPAEFFSLNPMQRADIILSEGPAEMAKDILIVNDPPALLQYRRSVQPYVVQNCATANCHNGSAPKFNLIIPAAESEQATYTNFYILTQYARAAKQQSGGVFARGQDKLVDRDRAADSLLLQYSLPGSLSDNEHPQVPSFRPPLRGMNDAKYVQLMNWIGQSLKPGEPEYGFTFSAAATQPAASAPAASEPAPPPQPATQPPAAQPRPARPAPPQPARPAPPARQPAR